MRQIDANGSILVTGSGSLLTFPNALADGELEVGVYSGSSSLNVTSNGNVSSGTLLLVGGFQSGASGTLSISSAGSVTAPYPAFGFTPGTTGTGMVTGAGSILNATSNLELGGDASFLHANGGTGTLTISSGGSVNAAATTFYSNTSSINISGGTLNTGGLSSANTGYGSISLTDPSSGYALNINGSSGTNAYSGSITGSGTLNKTGGSTQTLSGTLNCGTIGVTAGTLNLALAGINNAANYLNPQGGLTQVTSGTLALSGVGAQTGIYVQNQAVLNISGGAIVNASGPSLNLDIVVDGGTINVTGNGSQLNGQMNQISVGYFAPGILNVSNGATVSSPTFLIIAGGSSGSNGSSMSILSGGKAVAPVTVVGLNSGATGTLTVSGTGSTLNATSFVALGGDGSVGGTGLLNIANAGVVNAASTAFYSQPSSINISGGTLNTGSVSSFNTGYGSIALTDPTGGYALNINDANAAHSNTYSGNITGTGSLNKSGGSTQILSGNNTFTGPVLVTGGTLVLSGSNNFNFANVSSGTLSLGTTGKLASGANVTVYTGGTFTPSSSTTAIGTLNLSGGTLLVTQPNTSYALNKIVTGTSGGTVTDASGGATLLNLVNAGAGITVAGNSTWTTVAAGSIVNGTSADIPINISPGVTLTNGLGLVGFYGYTITGGGTLYENANPYQYSGSSITVTQGEFRVTDASSMDGARSFVGNLGDGFFTLDGGTFSYGGGSASTIKIINTTGNGGTIQIESASATLTIGVNSATTANLIKTGPGTLITAPFSASNLIINDGTLGLSHSAYLLKVSTLTVGAFTTLDLGSDAADISTGSLASLNLLVQQGYNGGRWNGSGITSSTAAADTRHLTAIGVIQNNQGGTAIYNSSHQFLSTTPGASDILLAYTYYGDTNLDGKVDGSDYSRIDAAYLADKTNPAAMTGWFNGDFNYDGVVNGSDYTLIDNAYNRQGAVLTGELASTTAQVGSSAVPEPTSMIMVALSTAALLGRRRKY